LRFKPRHRDRCTWNTCLQDDDQGSQPHRRVRPSDWLQADSAMILNLTTAWRSFDQLIDLGQVDQLMEFGSSRPAGGVFPPNALAPLQRPSGASWPRPFHKLQLLIHIARGSLPALIMTVLWWLRWRAWGHKVAARCRLL
jgi:hypothetical protein